MSEPMESEYLPNSPRRRAPSPLSQEWKPGFSNKPIEASSLRWRLALPFITILLVILVVLSVVLGMEARNRYLDQMSEDLRLQAQAIAVSTGLAVGDNESLDNVRGLIAELTATGPIRYTVIAADGVVVADSDSDPSTMSNHLQRPEVVDALASGYGQAVRESRTLGLEFMYVAVPIPGGDGAVIRVAMPMDSITTSMQSIWTTGAIAALVASIVVIGVAWYIAGRVVRPLEDLRQHAHALAAGDLSVRLNQPEMPEIAEVSQAFNRMTDELEQSQAAISEARLRLEAVLSELADGVVITDTVGVVLKMNSAAEVMLGASESNSVGKPFVQVCRDHELASILRTALDGEDHPEAAVEHGLNRRTLLTTAQVVYDGQDRLGLVVLRDISELRRLEMVRRDFVANVSHELRTPLTSIRAMVETLEAGAIDDPAVTMDFLGRIVHETDRLTALVEDLLDLARLEAGRTGLSYERTDVLMLLQDAANRLHTQLSRAQLDIQIEADDDLVGVRLDRKRVEQVLINLIHNAIKFTPPGGTITLRTYQVEDQTIIEVQDTGVGIPADEQIRLFERFYKSDSSRRSEGTGLGLAIVKHIVQTHGGTVSVESVVDEGSTFRVTLPNRKPKAKNRQR